ncbi:MAG TPA: hypothetical protein VLE44_03300 [Candidatus Saccharimonadales bacterium]|nr:hypothetical protein [Candidatus Saccharimonadales bacterium]
MSIVERGDYLKKAHMADEVVLDALYQVSESARMNREEDQGTRDIEGSLRQMTYYWSLEGRLDTFLFENNIIILRGGYDKEGKYDSKLNFEDVDFRDNVVDILLDFAELRICYPGVR